ncbi:MAG: hypothetical protein MJ188_02210 [Treponema sp.]|nr:hypothetical protein [Treponema sp.]
MKKNEKIIYLILGIYCIFSITICGIVVNTLNKKASINQIKLSAIKNITSGFENACCPLNETNLYAWQQKCRKDWELNYIAWSYANDFLIDTSTYNNSTLVYGVWESEVSNGEIFYRASK